MPSYDPAAGAAGAYGGSTSAGTTPAPGTEVLANGTTLDPWGTGQYGQLRINVFSGKANTPVAGVNNGSFDDVFQKQPSAPSGLGSNIFTNTTPGFPAQQNHGTFPYGGPQGGAQATVDDALNAGADLDSADLQDLQTQLWMAGMYAGTSVKTAAEIPFGHYDEATIKAYANLLKQSAAEVARGSNNSVQDTINELVAQKTAVNQQQLAQNGTGKTTSTNSQVSDPATAKSILVGALQAFTGSGVPDPTTLANFQQALASFEGSHPGTSTTTTPVDSTGAADYADQTTESAGGVTSAGRDQFAQDWLLQNDGSQVGAHQAATTFYQAAMSALGAPAQVQ